MRPAHICYHLHNLNRQKMDSTKTDEITSEQKQLEIFAQNRQHKFQQSLEEYLSHIKKQTEQLESTQSEADSRNKKISQIFEGVYERIMMGSQILSRKVKETSYQKKVFWENLIATNAEMNDLELKKDFYQQKRDAEDLYYDAIEAQKAKKISYTDLLGKMKADQSLKHWQQNNKKFQEKVTKGTKTLHQWKMFEEPHQKGNTEYDDNYDFIHQFTQSTPQNQWVKPIGNSKYTNNYGNSQLEDTSVLKDFYHRKF